MRDTNSRTTCGGATATFLPAVGSHCIACVFQIELVSLAGSETEKPTQMSQPEGGVVTEQRSATEGLPCGLSPHALETFVPCPANFRTVAPLWSPAWSAP